MTECDVMGLAEPGTAAVAKPAEKVRSLLLGMYGSARMRASGCCAASTLSLMRSG